MGRRSRATDDLRLTVECLPRHTKVAMLEGLRTGRIIAGSYTDDDGGTCPMLAAHRRGGRTDCLAFARAWDRFTGVGKGQGARVATRHEVRVLEAQLEGALLAHDAVDLGGAVADHQAVARERRAREAARTGTDWLHAPAPMPDDLAGDVGTTGRARRRRRTALA
ncbi:MAG: hypothetical protein MSC31_09070 [Solirubrobacteraceae bacterium MAG38_C4-C5]|nr:hypothetical protein [Candidatus Siliceabacter maunaloa]